MFKIDDKVVVKEIHKKYGRTNSTIEMLEDIREQGLIGKVITTDMSDGMLNIYVSFEGAESNIWFNDEELVKYNPFKLIASENVKVVGMIGEFQMQPTKEDTDSVEQEEIVEEEKELDNEMKDKLLDYLVKEVMKSNYEELMFKYIVNCYADTLIDNMDFNLFKDEAESIVEFLLNKFVSDFNVNKEDLIKKFK